MMSVAGDTVSVSLLSHHDLATIQSNTPYPAAIRHRQFSSFTGTPGLSCAPRPRLFAKALSSPCPSSPSARAGRSGAAPDAALSVLTPVRGPARKVSSSEDDPARGSKVPSCQFLDMGGELGGGRESPLYCHRHSHRGLSGTAQERFSEGRQCYRDKGIVWWHGEGRRGDAVKESLRGDTFSTGQTRLRQCGRAASRWGDWQYDGKKA